MKAFYHQDPEPSDPVDEELLGHLSVGISKDGEFIFSCDWTEDDGGVDSMSSIFYSLGYDELIDQILVHLKDQCVLKGREEEFTEILKGVKNRILLSDIKEDSGDDIAVSPRNVLKL